jgi:hypothetical protein
MTAVGRYPPYIASGSPHAPTFKANSPPLHGSALRSSAECRCVELTTYSVSSLSPPKQQQVGLVTGT